MRQARYDGAVGARVMHSLQNYGQEEAVYDGQAYTYISTYHNGQLQLYAHHTTAPATEGDRPEYHMTQLRGFTMTDTRETFVQGATAYRNLRDLAKQHWDTFIGDANARYQAAQESPITTAASPSEDNTSADELAYTPQASQSIATASDPAARLTASVTSSSTQGKSHDRHKASSNKRHRSSHSPTSGSHRPKKQGSGGSK